MLRILLVAAAVTAAYALITRSSMVRWALHVILALLALYAVLKITGAIDAIAPDRDGVF